jgi:D-3-phosphoglycerate dehydrogenase
MTTYRILNAMRVETCPDALAVFDGIGTVDTVPGDPDSVAAVIGEYDAYLAALTVPFDAAMVGRANRLKVIGSPSTGTDHLDLAAIDAAGIVRFDISREINLIRSFTATSELAFALALNVNRRILPATRSVLEGEWGRETYTGFQFSGKTFGILGLGRLGRISARIAQGFGMRTIAHDIRDVDAPNVTMVDFTTLFREADVLTIHVHLRDDTRGLVDARAISLMKRNAILINTSRARLVDNDALLHALRNGTIAGAGLDVIDGEWDSDIAQNHLVNYARHHDNLVITPHIGGATHESINGARIFMAKKVADYLRSLGT